MMSKHPFPVWQVTFWFLSFGLCAGCGSTGPASPPDVLEPPSAEIRLQASPLHGETPFETTLSWHLESARLEELGCELDLEGDGTADEVLSPCPAEGSLPWVYTTRGEYNPRITVVTASGEEVASASLRVFSNELVFVEEVYVLDEAPSFAGFAVDGNVVTVQLAAETASTLGIGTILLSREDGGLLRRVVSVGEVHGAVTEFQTESVGLDEAIAEGFWGLLPASPLSPEAARNGLGGASKADLLGIDADLSTPVITFSPAVPDVSVSGGGGQLALTDIEVQGSAHAGIHAFILKKGLFSPLVFDIAVWTAAQWHLGATVVGGASKSWKQALPTIPLGAVMVGPVPITFGLEPALFGSVTVESSLRVGTDGSVYVMGGAHNLSGGITPYGDIDFDSEFLLEPPDAAATGTAKAGLSVRLKVQVASMLGPFAQAGGYAKAKLSVAPDELCVDTSLGIEGAVGGQLEFFKVIDVEFSYPFNIAEWPLWSDCFELPCQPDCSEVACGPDPSCASSCGVCPDGFACADGQCEAQEACGNGSCDAGESYQSCPQDCQCEPDCGEEALIPAGPFLMGCNTAVDTQCDTNEYPSREVLLSSYHIDVTEVTQAAYQACVYAGVCEVPGCDWEPLDRPGHPVVCVDWHAAEAYCAWAGKRLPSEAEWEKAARGAQGPRFPWGNEAATCERAVMKEGGAGCGTDDTAAVCSRSPLGDSPFGLCDMAGNVWEWVHDWYDEAYYKSAPSENPPGPETGTHRGIRGSSLYGTAPTLRTSYRERSLPDNGLSFVGFRCARSD